MRISKLSPILFFAFALPLSGSLCVPDLLSNYIALGATGCQIGNMNVVDFAYSSLAGNTVSINASDITVTPAAGGGEVSVKFTSALFDVSGTNVAKYLIAYTWDPGDVRGMEDVMDANSPTFPGFASVSTLACKDAAFIGTLCPTSTASLFVSDDGVTKNLTDTTAFSPGIGIVGVRNTLELDGNGARSEITGFSNILTPEPSTVGTMLLAIAGLFIVRRRTSGAA